MKLEKLNISDFLRIDFDEESEWKTVAELVLSENDKECVTSCVVRKYASEYGDFGKLFIKLEWYQNSDGFRVDATTEGAVKVNFVLSDPTTKYKGFKVGSKSLSKLTFTSLEDGEEEAIVDINKVCIFKKKNTKDGKEIFKAYFKD